MYDDGFSRVYDQFMDDFDYPKWAEHYIGIIKRAGWDGGEILECACGTGSLTLELLRRGIKVTGADISESMLRAAQRKCMENGHMTRFVRMDMRSLAFPHQVSAIIAACDGVNYLTTADDVRAFFSAAYRALKPGGVLAFDISAPYKYERVLAGGFFGEERDDAAYLWQNEWDAEHRIINMDLTFFVREKGDMYRRFGETHVQRSHTIPEIECWLNECGYIGIDKYREFELKPPDGSEMRLHFAAAKPRRQE